MEALLPSEVARLVYGYLEAEKCSEAALLFLQTSQHLKECHAFYLQYRRFSTKVMGLTLLQCLDYLCSVYRIVQSHLNTFENDPLEKLSLPEQLNFLLNSMNFNAGNNDQTARVSNQVDPKTPEKVATSAFQKMTRKSRTKNTSDKSSFPGSSAVFTSFPFPVDDDVGPVLPVPETTSLESLPGNTRNRRKSPLKVKDDDFFSDEGSANQTAVDANRFKKPNLPNLTNLFLEKPDLCSKISKNINKALKLPEKPRAKSKDKSKDVGKSAGEQLDTAIKSLVNQLVDEDSVFDDVLSEIIDQLPTPAMSPTSPKNMPKAQEIPKTGTIPEIHLAHGDVLPTVDFGNDVLPPADLQLSSKNAQIDEVCPSKISSPQKTEALSRTCSASDIGELQKPPENIMEIPETISIQPASVISSQIPASHLPEQLSVNCVAHPIESSTPQLLELTNMKPAEVSSIQPLTVSTVAVTGSSAQPVELSRISPLQVSSLQPVQVTNSQRVGSSIIVLAEAANLVESQQLVMQTADGYYSFIPTSTELYPTSALFGSELRISGEDIDQSLALAQESSTVSSEIISNKQHGRLIHFSGIPTQNEFVNIAPKPGSTSSTNFLTEMLTTNSNSVKPVQKKRSRPPKEPRRNAKKKKEATVKPKKPLVVEVRVLDAAKDPRSETSSDCSKNVTAAESYRQLVEAMSFVGDERSATPRKTPVKSTNLISIDTSITPSKPDSDPGQTKPKEDSGIPVEIASKQETTSMSVSNLPKIETAEDTTSTESAPNCGVVPIENRAEEESPLKSTDSVSAVTETNNQHDTTNLGTIPTHKELINNAPESTSTNSSNFLTGTQTTPMPAVLQELMKRTRSTLKEPPQKAKKKKKVAAEFQEPVSVEVCSLDAAKDPCLETSSVNNDPVTTAESYRHSVEAVSSVDNDRSTILSKVPVESINSALNDTAISATEPDLYLDQTKSKEDSDIPVEITSNMPEMDSEEDTLTIESASICGRKPILTSASNPLVIETAEDTKKINPAPNCGPETTLASASNLPEMQTAEDTTKIDSAPNCAVVSIENRTEDSSPKMTDADVLDEINPKTKSQIEFAAISPLRVANNHRQSLSTPRRKKSHVRILDFGTPPNFEDSFQRKANTSPKALKSSEPPSERLKSIRRAELFQSPDTSWYLATTPYTGNHDTVKLNTNTPPPVRSIMSPPSCIKEASPLSRQESLPPSEKPKFTIATRSPQLRLSGSWDKINGLGLIVNSPKSISFKSCDEDSNSLSCSKSLVNTVESTPLKESWDSKLRAMLRGDYKEPEPPKKQTQSKRSPKKSNSKTSTMSKAKVSPKKHGQKKNIEISPVKISPEPSSSVNAPNVSQTMSILGTLSSAKERKIEKESFSRETDLEVSQSKLLQEVSSETISVIDQKLLQNPVIQVCKSIQPSKISNDKLLDVGKFIKKSKSRQDQENTMGVSQENSEETCQLSKQLKSQPQESNPKISTVPKAEISPIKRGRKKNIKISPVKISPRPFSFVNEPCDADSEVRLSTISVETKSEKITEANTHISRSIQSSSQSVLSNRIDMLLDASKFIKMFKPDQDQKKAISVSQEKSKEGGQSAELKKQTKSRMSSEKSNLKTSTMPKAISSPKTRSQKKNIQNSALKTSSAPPNSANKPNARTKGFSSPERSPLKPLTARERKVKGEKLSCEADSEVFQSKILRKGTSDQISERDSQLFTSVLPNSTDEEFSLDAGKFIEKSKSYQDQENTIGASQEKIKETSQFSPPKKETKSKSNYIKSDLKSSSIQKVKLSAKKDSKKKNITISPVKLSPAPSCSINELNASSKMSFSSLECSPVKPVLTKDREMEVEKFFREANSKASQSKISQKVKSAKISETDAQMPRFILPNSLNDDMLFDEGKIIGKSELDQNNTSQEKSKETGQPMEESKGSPKKSNRKIRKISKAKPSLKKCEEKKIMEIFSVKISSEPSSSVAKPSVSPTKSFSPPELSPIRPLTAKERETEGDNFSCKTDTESSPSLPNLSPHKLETSKKGKKYDKALDVSKFIEKPKSCQDAENIICAIQGASRTMQLPLEPKKQTESKCSPVKSYPETSTTPKAKLNPNKWDRVKNMKISPMMASPPHSSSNSKPNAGAISSFLSSERSPLRPLSVKEREMEGEQFSYETNLEISQLRPKFSFHRPDIKNPVLDFPADEDVLKSGSSTLPPSSSNISELAAATTENQATQDNSPVAAFSTPELLSVLQKAESGILARADSSIHRSISPSRSNDNLLLDAGKFIDKSESEQDQTNVICASQKNSQQPCQFSEQSVNINKREESIIYTPKESLQNIIYISSDENPFPFKSNVDHKANEEFLKNYSFSVEYEIDEGLINVSTNTITEESVLLSIPSVHNEMTTDTIVNVHGKEANQEREERTTQILTMRHASESSLKSEKGPHVDRQEEEHQSQRSPSSDRSFRPEKGHDRDHHQEERHQPQKSLPSDKCDRPLSHEKAHHRDHHREERHQPQISQSSEKCDTPLSPEKRHHSDYHCKGKQQRQKSQSSDECDTPLSPEKAHHRDHHWEERHQAQRSLSSDKCYTPLSPEKGHHRDHHREERHQAHRSLLSDKCYTPLSPEKRHHRDHHRKERHQRQKYQSSNECDTPLSPEEAHHRDHHREERHQPQRSLSSNKCDTPLNPEKGHHRDHRSKERHHPRKSQSSDECDTPLSPEKSHHRDHHREERHQAHKSLSSDKCDTPLSPEKGCHRGYYRKEKFESQRSPSSDKCDRSLSPEREHYRDSQLRSSRSSGSKYGKYKNQFPTHGREKWKKQKSLPYSYPDQIRPNERLKHRSRSPVREALQKGSAKFTTGKKWHRVTFSEGRNLCNKNSPSEDKRSSESFSRSQRSLERQQTYREKPNFSQRYPSSEAVYLNKRRDQHRDPLSRFTSSETRLSCKEVHMYKKSRDTARHSSTSHEVRDCRERNREQDNYFPLRKSPYRIIPPKHQHRDSSGKYQSSEARQSPEEVQMHSQSKHKVSTSPIFLKDQDIRERNQGQDHYPSSKKRARDGDRHSNYHDRHNQETKSSGNSSNHKRSPQSPDFSHQQKLEVTHETETTLPLDLEGADLSPNAGLSQEVIMGLKEKGLYDDYVKFWKLKKSQRQQEEKMSPDEYRTSNASNIQDGSGYSLQDSELEDERISSDSVASNFGAEPNNRSTSDQQDLEIKELMVKRRKIEESSDENTSTSDLPVKSKHEAKNLLDKQDIDSFLRKIHPPEKEGIHFNDSE